MGETELEKRIDEQFQEWFQLLNKSSITIGFLSAIAALSVESVPLLILSFVAWMSFILYNKNEAFPNILRILRKIDNGQNSVVTNIRTKYEKKTDATRLVFSQLALLGYGACVRTWYNCVAFLSVCFSVALNGRS